MLDRFCHARSFFNLISIKRNLKYTQTHTHWHHYLYQRVISGKAVLAWTEKSTFLSSYKERRWLTRMSGQPGNDLVIVWNHEVEWRLILAVKEILAVTDAERGSKQKHLALLGVTCPDLIGFSIGLTTLPPAAFLLLGRGAWSARAPGRCSSVVRSSFHPFRGWAWVCVS